MHILTVEDEPAMAQLLESALREEGHLVTLATNGSDALRTAFNARFDLIVLDLMLPGKNGFEVARESGVSTPTLRRTRSMSSSACCAIK